MVIDSSALLAVFLKESSGPWVIEQLEKNRSNLLMSTINVTEVLIILRKHKWQHLSEIESHVFASEIKFISPSLREAEIAAESRLKFPLNIGDCFVYALAKEKNLPILTLDKDFKKTDADLIIP